MTKIRVLVVDDSVVFRRSVSDVLSSDPMFAVVGTAPNGRIALAKLSNLAPDLIILDVEMPEMDGLATLVEVRKIYPDLPIIMFSALTELGAAATFDALALGATDYVTKPVGGSPAESVRVLRDELLPTLKAICTDKKKPTSAAKVPTRMDPAKPALMEVLAIGTSTGGPNALSAILGDLPADFPVPIVVVQHMPPLFTRLLAERLTAKSLLSVREAAGGELIVPGEVWLAPGDAHMEVVREHGQARLVLHHGPPENSCRPSVDVLFRSVALAYGSDAVSLVLTGMGQDGLRGCDQLHRAGGRVIVQDEASSVVWGMPGAVAAAGIADQVLPLDQIAGEILHRARVGRTSDDMALTLNGAAES